MADGEVFEANVNWSLGVQQFTNVLHFRQVGSDGTGDAREGLIRAIESGIEFFWLGAIASDTILVSYAVRKLFPIQTQQFIKAKNIPGTGNEDAIAPNIAALIAFYGQMEGRKGVGRVYVSGIEEDHVSGGSLTADGRTLMNGLADGLISTVTDVVSAYSFQLGIWDSVASVIRDAQHRAVRFRCSNIRSRTLSLG